jgi:hypothetical protein
VRWPRASFETRLKWDALERPDYAYGTFQAAQIKNPLAKLRRVAPSSHEVLLMDGSMLLQ